MNLCQSCLLRFRPIPVLHHEKEARPIWPGCFVYGEGEGVEKREKKDYNKTKPQLRQGSWRTAVPQAELLFCAKPPLWKPLVCSILLAALF